MPAFFLNPDPRQAATAVLSASSEVGITVGVPVSGSSNRGALRLVGAGVPRSSTKLDVALQAGGLANGLYSRVTSASGTTGVPGAAIRWRETGDPADKWRGHTDNTYLTYARMIHVGGALQDYPQVSEPRTLGNGSIGFVYVADGISSGLYFAHKSARTSGWTSVQIGTGTPSPSSRPAWVVRPDGRIIVWAYFAATEAVDSYASDDNGATWSTWSTTTGIAQATPYPTICAEVSGDSIAIVTGGSESTASTLRVWWSLDGGQTFGNTSTLSTLNPSIVRTTVTATGQVLCAVAHDDSGGTPSGYVYPVAYGGGLGSSVLSWSVNAARPMVAMTCTDDGALWVFTNGGSSTELASIAHTVSLDNGATWVTMTNAANVFNNQTLSGTPRGPSQLVAGAYLGSVVFLTRSECATATISNGLTEWWLGGWDTLTETNLSDSEGSKGTYPYGGSGGLSLGPDELPENLGWARTDLGAGATVAQTANGVSFVATAGNNSSYSYGWAPGVGDGWRFRLVFRVSSGGSTANDSLAFFVAAGDGVNRQWFKLRFSSTSVRLLDTSGTLASATPFLPFTDYVEVFAAFQHDYTPGAGRLSVYYRQAANTTWSTLAAGVTIAEEAGVATEEIRFGGLSSTSAASWDLAYLGVAEGGRLSGGFTNPTDLHGRPLSSALTFETINGVRVGAFGGSGIVGDTYTIATAYNYAARNLWLTRRLTCRWDAATGGDQNAVFYMGDTWRADTFTVHGINWRRGKIQLHTADSWASPTVSVGLDATVWTGTVSKSAAGIVTVDGAPWIPHRFKSTRGRRWFLVYGTLPEVAAEILDNGDDTLTVSGLPGTLTPGDKIAIYGDRAGVILGAARDLPYMRLVIDNGPCPDTYFRTGYLGTGVRHVVTMPYDSGFVDRALPNVLISETTSGYRHAAVAGPGRAELRVAWGLIDRLSSDYMERLSTMLATVERLGQPIPFWRDPDDVTTLGLYRITGPVVRENAYGELSTAFDRLAQIVLSEEDT